MPVHAASSPPAMTPYPANAHASTSRTAPGPRNAIQSLADLYNSRHVQESTSSSSRSVSSSSLADLYNKRHSDENGKRQPSSNSLVDLYNKQHRAERRKEQSSSSSLADLYTEQHRAEPRREKPSSTSLADLYNQRYETELQEDDDSIEEVPRTKHRIISSGAKHADASGRSRKDRIPRAVSLDSSDDETPEPQSLLPSDIDELEAGDDDMELDSTPVRDSHHRSLARSVSVATLSDRPELVYVRSIPRRGALGASATRRALESDDDEPGTPEPENFTASGSSLAALARPHRSPSKLVVHSATSDSLESGLSTPPIAPHHRNARTIPHHVLSSTQEEESMDSLFRSDMVQEGLVANEAVESSRSASEASRASRSVHSDAGPFDHAAIVGDFSFDGPPQSAASPQGSLAEESRASIGFDSEHSHLSEREAVVMLPSPDKSMREKLAEDPNSRTSTSSRQTSPVANHCVADQDIDAGSDADSDIPVITEARIRPVQPAESSAGVTTGDASDSDAQRSRYPRRARNVTDYNVKRAFERFEREQLYEAAGASVATAASSQVPLARTMKSKKMLLPIVTAAPEFFDALRAKPADRAANQEPTPSSFAEFVLAKARSDSASIAPSTRSHLPTTTLTEAQARAIPKLKFGVTSLLDITVNTEDRGSLLQLKPSTRRWLGIAGPGPLSVTEEQKEESVVTPPLPGARTPLRLKLGDLISSHDDNRMDRVTLREALGLNDSGATGAGLVGRPIGADRLESAARHLRLGRTYKQPLPDTLRSLADLEHHEWVRLEEYIPEIERIREEEKAREQGQILVEELHNERIQVQYDGTGRMRSAKIRCFTGGQLRVYYDTEQSSPLLPEEDSQTYKIVRKMSPRKSPSISRLASVPVRDHSDEEVGMDVKDLFGNDTASVGRQSIEPSARAPATAESRGPLFELHIPATQPPSPSLPPHKEAQQKRAQTASNKALDSQPASKKAATEIPPSRDAHPKSLHNAATSSKIKPTPKPAPTSTLNQKAGKVKQSDLLSFFSTQTSPPQPSSRTATTLAPASKPAKSKEKGKRRVLDDDVIEVWPSSSCTPDPGVQVFVDLTRSSSASEGTAPRSKRVRSPSPSTVSAKKRKAVLNDDKVPRKTVGLGSRDGDLSHDPFLQAEAQRRAVQRRRFEAAEADEEVSALHPRLQDRSSGSIDRDGVSVMLPAVRDEDVLGESVGAKRKNRIGPKSVTSRHQHAVDGDSDDDLPLRIPGRPRQQTSQSALVQVQLSPPPRTSTLMSPPKARSRPKPNTAASSSIALPAPTPSPSRGGWAGISGWYANTREGFSPTPANELAAAKVKAKAKAKAAKKAEREAERASKYAAKSDRARAKDSRRSKSDQVMLSQKRPS